MQFRLYNGCPGSASVPSSISSHLPSHVMFPRFPACSLRTCRLFSSSANQNRHNTRNPTLEKNALRYSFDFKITPSNKAPPPQPPRLKSFNTSRAVKGALIGNIIVLVSKMVGFYTSGSEVMLAEFFHSLVDLVNSFLLVVGVSQATRRPTDSHPYGFGQYKPLWGLFASCFTFFGGIISLYRGMSTLLNPHPILDYSASNYALILSGVVDTAILFYSLVTLYRLATHANQTPFKYLFSGSDTAVSALVLEDAASLGGVFLAYFCLHHSNAHLHYDAAGSALIGGLLMAFGISMFMRNTTLLLGKAMPKERQDRLVQILIQNKNVKRVLDVKSYDSTPSRFKAEIEWDGRSIVEEMIVNKLLSPTISEFARLLAEEFHANYRKYYDDHYRVHYHQHYYERYHEHYHNYYFDYFHQHYHNYYQQYYEYYQSMSNQSDINKSLSKEKENKKEKEYHSNNIPATQRSTSSKPFDINGYQQRIQLQKQTETKVDDSSSLPLSTPPTIEAPVVLLPPLPPPLPQDKNFVLPPINLIGAPVINFLPIQTVKDFLAIFGELMLQQAGCLVDEIESKMHEIEPELHIDLETHASTDIEALQRIVRQAEPELSADIPPESAYEASLYATLTRQLQELVQKALEEQKVKEELAKQPTNLRPGSNSPHPPPPSHPQPHPLHSHSQPSSPLPRHSRKNE